MSTARQGLWIAFIVAVAAIAAIGAHGADRPGDRTLIALDGVRETIIPAMRVISFDSSVGLLDTRTGAIYGLRGNLRNSSSPKHWKLEVRPVKEPTSGLLELQRATFNNPELVFLVDAVTGSTWLLNRRGDGSATWDPMKVHE